MKDDKSLIDQAKQGVEGAFSSLFTMYYNSIQYTIYNIVRNKDVTDDLLSVTFTKAFKKISCSSAASVIFSATAARTRGLCK